MFTSPGESWVLDYADLSEKQIFRGVAQNYLVKSVQLSSGETDV